MTKFTFEKITIFLISVSFFIGIWHAFPMLNVVNDEMYYVGGVLRALENHTIIPAPNDVPYGTVTYLINFVFSVFTISVLFPFFGFNLTELKNYLVVSPEIMYLTLRVTSAISGIFILHFVNKILKKEFEDFRVRLFILVLLFTNIITTVIFHTGKVWVVSTLFVVVSFYYLYISITEENANHKKNIFLSILFSFLAVSNFPLNFYSLLSIPILLKNFWNDKVIVKKIIIYSFLGFVIFLGITLLNFTGIKNQILSIFTQYNPVLIEENYNFNFLSSITTYFKKIVILFPLVLLSIFISIKEGIKNKKLFNLALIYFFVYFISITLIANWTTDLKTYLRYLFPIGFFLAFILSSLKLVFKRYFYVISGISVLYFVFTIYLLSVPTTYNKALDWVNSNLGQQEVIIVNEVVELQLLKNKDSSIYTKEKFCASKCKHTISSDLNSTFKPLVVDLNSKLFDLDKRNEKIYYITENISESRGLSLVAQFTNESAVYHSIDYNIGSYFDIDLLKTHNLGKNIYIYELTK